MKQVVCDSAKELAELSSEWCRTKIEQFSARSIFIPAGQSPVSLYEKWESESPSYLRSIDLLQIDDVLTGPERGVFARFFEKHLPSYQNQFRQIGPNMEIADLAILGLGLNGHIAFHEPGLPTNFTHGCVRLSEMTCAHLKMNPGTWGITYGAGAFIRCKSILLIVKGEAKKPVLERFLRKDPSLPVTALFEHVDLTIAEYIRS